MLTLVTPTGIGDISWIYSKISELAKTRPIGIEVPGGEPKRAVPYVEMLPNITSLGYGDWWKDFPTGCIDVNTDLASLPDGRYRIQANTALEQGVRLENIFPHQPTQFHYDLNFSQADERDAESMLAKHEGLRIGIYASSYRPDPLFTKEQWLWLCQSLNRKYPDAAFYFLGAWWDQFTYEVADALHNEGITAISEVGETSCGTVLRFIKSLDYFFAFPSGLGILANVMGTPTTMWHFRQHPTSFLNSYAAPEDIASGRFLNLYPESIQNSYDQFLEKGAQYIHA